MTDFEKLLSIGAVLKGTRCRLRNGRRRAMKIESNRTFARVLRPGPNVLLVETPLDSVGDTVLWDSEYEFYCWTKPKNLVLA